MCCSTMNTTALQLEVSICSLFYAYYLYIPCGFGFLTRTLAKALCFGWLVKTLRLELEISLGLYASICETWYLG